MFFVNPKGNKERMENLFLNSTAENHRKFSNMKYKWFLLLLIIFFSFHNSDAQEKEGALFIIGGGSRPPEMVERIVKESGLDREGYAIILPMASAEPDSAVYYAKQQFTAQGQNNVYGLIFTKGDSPSPQQLDSLRKAKLIYISGGDQDRFMQVVKNTPIAEAIHENYKNGGVIAGTSAGAAVMSKKMITGTEKKHPEYHSTFRHLEEDNLELKEGLGLLEGVIIDQHFVRRSRYNRLLSAIIESPELKGIGIDESTAILVRGNKAEVVGDSQVIVFSNPKMSKKSSEGKLAAEGLQLDIYLDGDTFPLK